VPSKPKELLVRPERDRAHDRMKATLPRSSTNEDQNALTHAEWMLSALRETGADAVTAMQMHVTLYAYAQGLASNFESEAEAQGEAGVDEEAWMRLHEPEFAALAATGAFPTFARILGELEGGFDLDLDRVFELGLGVLLDGFARATSRKES
jgi:hypothetical protein